jgi:hypothetical protein
MGFWRHIYRLRQKIEKDAAARRVCDAEQHPDLVILVQGKMVTFRAWHFCSLKPSATRPKHCPRQVLPAAYANVRRPQRSMEAESPNGRLRSIPWMPISALASLADAFQALGATRDPSGDPTKTHQRASLLTLC